MNFVYINNKLRIPKMTKRDRFILLHNELFEAFEHARPHEFVLHKNSSRIAGRFLKWLKSHEGVYLNACTEYLATLGAMK